MGELGSRLIQLKDRFGREASLRAFESFWLFLDSGGMLTLHGCEKIVTCTEREIFAVCRDRTASVTGTALLVRSLDQTEIEISGNIESIVLKEKKPDRD